MAPNTANKIQRRESAKDVFYTPDVVAKTHIQQIVAKDNEIWLDPFFGKGVYFNNFQTDKKVWTEIELMRDFFTFSGKVDIIVSNPPYSKLDDVFKKSIELKPRVISYLLLHGSMTPKRLEFMKANGYGLVSVYITKVYKWYGMSEAYTFEKDKGYENVVYFWDRIVHR